jgi:hypothetical protein
MNKMDLDIRNRSKYSEAKPIQNLSKLLILKAPVQSRGNECGTYGEQDGSGAE